MELGATQRISQGHRLPGVDAQAGTGGISQTPTKKIHTKQSPCQAQPAGKALRISRPRT